LKVSHISELCASPKMRKIAFILFLFINSIYGQDKSNNLIVSGNLKVFFGTELATPKSATIELTPNLEIVDIDSLVNINSKI
jgi:hypothetical protein